MPGTKASTTAPTNMLGAVIDGIKVTTNTVEGPYFSIFKRGMIGVYQHCSEKHLHHYLSEFDFRYGNRVESSALMTPSALNAPLRAQSVAALPIDSLISGRTAKPAISRKAFRAPPPADQERNLALSSSIALRCLARLAFRWRSRRVLAMRLRRRTQ